VIREHAADPDLTALDRALDQAYYSRVLTVLEEDFDEEGQAVIEALKDDIDLANLRMALKAAYSGGSPLPSKPLARGRLQVEKLTKVASCGSLAEAVGQLEGTAYKTAHREGVLEAAQANDLGGVERALQRVRVKRLVTRSLEDPVGIGFTVRYLNELDLEAQSLRLVARAAAGLIPVRVAEEALIHG
jgi:vacuolar-type H+-ATPase subunit C/Vma6